MSRVQRVLPKYFVRFSVYLLVPRSSLEYQSIYACPRSLQYITNQCDNTWQVRVLLPMLVRQRMMGMVKHEQIALARTDRPSSSMAQIAGEDEQGMRNKDEK